MNAPPTDRRRGERALVPDAEFRTYYDRPVLKEPVWRWEIPAYFFVGGLAAGASMLATGAELTGSPEVARRARLVAAAGAAVSTGLLVSDLGWRTRFHHMLRVAKPTSPMSMGSWALAAFGTSAGVATTSDVLGVAPRVGRLAGLTSSALAPVIATYTAVLVSDTAIPVWHEAHRELPFLFVGGAAAAGGAAGLIVAPGDRAARRFLLLGAVLEIVAARRMEHELPEPVATPYREGKAARWSKLAQALTVGGAGLVGLGRRRRLAGAAGAALVLAGAALERFAVLEAGRASARDPRAVVASQRAGSSTG